MRKQDSSTGRVRFRVHPMLATLVSEPFHKPGWVYEEKYDGFRMLAYKEESRVSLLSRNAKDRTHTFPDKRVHLAKCVAGDFREEVQL